MILLKIIFSGFFSFLTSAAEPALTIQLGNEKQVYTREELLKRASVREIQVVNDPAFPLQPKNKPLKYRALPLADLFQSIKIPDNSTLAFQCVDGFSAVLPAASVLSQAPQTARAFLAIEEKNKPWPKLTTGISPGPFYLVWLDPEKSQIGREQWPFHLKGFVINTAIDQQYPKIVPAPGSPADVIRGYHVFVKNCFACHTFNGEGTSQMGPDLNQPSSPIEYMNVKYLRNYIRNPKSLRDWPQGKMPGFSQELISEREVDDLLAYFKEMANRR